MKKTYTKIIVILVLLLSAFAVYKTKYTFLSEAIRNTANGIRTSIDKNSTHDRNAAINILKTKKYGHLNSDLRKFPYPYRAMLSLCSDIDGTTLKAFENYHRFLNTKGDSIYGSGLGLDVADSFWVYMGLRTNRSGVNYNYIMTAVSGTDINKINELDKIKYYYDMGWIDSLHSFGDFSETNPSLYVKPVRKLAIDAWSLLNKYNIKPKVWINHGDDKNLQNFGGYAPNRITNYQQGDNPNSLCYHTDLTIKNGVRFIWNSLGSQQFGMDSPIYKIKLRDHQTIWGFSRYTNIYSGNKLQWLWTPDKIDKQLTRNNLDELVRKNQYSIIGLHLGEGKLLPNGVNALRTLSAYQDKGKILIARTSRLLEYAIAQRFIQYAATDYRGVRYINIRSIADPVFGHLTPTLEFLRGITFNTASAKKTVLMVNYEPIDSKDLVVSQTNRQTIGIKWHPSDFTDYTLNHK